MSLCLVGNFIIFVFCHINKYITSIRPGTIVTVRLRQTIAFQSANIVPCPEYASMLFFVFCYVRHEGDTFPHDPCFVDGEFLLINPFLLNPIFEWESHKSNILSKPIPAYPSAPETSPEFENNSTLGMLMSPMETDTVNRSEHTLSP